MSACTSLSERLAARVNKTASCWIWNGCKGKDGYGAITYRQKYMSAHRAAYIVANGLIPDGMFVCHHCDNKLCVRPDHLFVGTPQDNVLDCVKKGRHSKQKNKTCPRGHSFSGRNLRYTKLGHRICVTCHLAKSNESRIRNKDGINFRRRATYARQKSLGAI